MCEGWLVVNPGQCANEGEQVSPLKIYPRQSRFLGVGKESPWRGRIYRLHQDTARRCRSRCGPRSRYGWWSGSEPVSEDAQPWRGALPSLPLGLHRRGGSCEPVLPVGSPYRAGCRSASGSSSKIITALLERQKPSRHRRFSCGCYRHAVLVHDGLADCRTLAEVRPRDTSVQRTRQQISSSDLRSAATPQIA